MAALPASHLDPATPPDVVVTDHVRAPVADPTLGRPLGEHGPAPVGAPAHPLVVVGDSLTQGMSSGAVSRTDLAWPAVVARCIGEHGFTGPRYAGPLDGLPFNLESLLRALERDFGPTLNPLELFVSLPVALQRLADGNEDHWERGAGAAPPPTDTRYHNLAVYGWDLRDSLSFTAGRAADRASAPTGDDFTGAVPEHDNDIAADTVLAPFGPDATQLTAARRHGLDGGIGTLVIALGANNALTAVVDKKVVWSGPAFADLDAKQAYTVWRPTHFTQEYGHLVTLVRTIPARRVLLTTVPHVTVAPIAHGVNPDRPGQKWRPGSRYFPFYTDPWIAEADFRPTTHRHLTHQQARAIDSAIDQYNDVIAEAVRDARDDGRDWYLFDLCGLLDGLAHRRFAADPAAAARNGWRPRALPAALAGLDTRFFRSDPTGRLQGGLFSLDAVHPTASGYGLIAQAVLDVLAVAGVAGQPVDLAAVRRADTLNARPPALMNGVLGLLTPFLDRLLTRRQLR